MIGLHTLANGRTPSPKTLASKSNLHLWIDRVPSHSNPTKHRSRQSGHHTQAALHSLMEKQMQLATGIPEILTKCGLMQIAWSCLTSGENGQKACLIWSRLCPPRQFSDDPLVSRSCFIRQWLNTIGIFDTFLQDLQKIRWSVR